MSFLFFASIKFIHMHISSNVMEKINVLVDFIKMGTVIFHRHTKGCLVNQSMPGKLDIHLGTIATHLVSITNAHIPLLVSYVSFYK